MENAGPFLPSVSSRIVSNICCYVLKWKKKRKCQLLAALDTQPYLERMLISILFRPPFINGRPQKTDFIFGEKKAKAPVFEEFSPVFFISFSFTSFVTWVHQGSPGVTRGHQERFPWVPLGSRS